MSQKAVPVESNCSFCMFCAEQIWKQSTWQAGVPVMELEEYADFVTDLIELLPPKMVLHRLTGDGPKRLLIAPLWSAQKKVVLNAIQQNLLKKDICQGRLFHTASVFSDSAKNPENPSFP